MTDDTQRRIAEMLYDELTGRHTCDPFDENAVLATVNIPTRPRADYSQADLDLHRLLLDADYLGYEVHRKPGDRWKLAQRLAVKVEQIITAEESA